MSIDYAHEKLSFIISQIDEILSKSTEQQTRLQNSTLQASLISEAVTKHVNSTINDVTGNENIAEVNQQLAQSLVDVRSFMAAEPGRINTGLVILQERVKAYQTCASLINDAMSDLDSYDSKLDQIKQKIETGEFEKIRQPGDRPERIKDVRRAQQIIDDEKSAEENI